MTLEHFHQRQICRHPRKRLLVFIAISFAILFGSYSTFAQQSFADLQKILGNATTFDAADFAALSQNQTVVKLLPAKDPRDVAVHGVVSLEVPTEVFLESFRESLSRKTNEAILEIGRFGNTPAAGDLQNLTLESRDIDDLKSCVVGDCQLKLSASMIERFHSQLDPNAADYPVRATQLFKAMLLDYVNEYRARGDAALIEYSDKAKSVRVAEEQQALLSSSPFLKNILPALPHNAQGLPPGLSMVENALVWSKIKFGLKPVIAINHVMVFKRQQSPQVLVVSKQIYANHYFDSSLALTAFVHTPGASPSSYLIYENHSRADGLGGAFGKLKRGIIENRAMGSLKGILENSRTNLTARAFHQVDTSSPAHEGRPWRIRKSRLLSFILGIGLLAGVSSFVALMTLRSHHFKGVVGGRVQ